MQHDSVLRFVALRQQVRKTDQPASAQHLILPIPRTELQKTTPSGRNEQTRIGNAHKDAEAGKPFVNLSRRRPDQAPASHGDVFDTDAEDLDESLTTSLVDVDFPNESSKGQPLSRAAPQDGRAMVEHERTQRVHQMLPTLHKPGVQTIEADDDAYINSSSDEESQQASNVSESSNHEPQDGLSQMLRFSSLPGPNTMFARTRPVPIQHSKKILESDGTGQATFEMVYGSPLEDQDARSMIITRDTATLDPNHQQSLEFFSRTGKCQFRPPAPRGHGLIRDSPGVHEYSSNGQASSAASSTGSTLGEPVGQEDQVSGHNPAADRASLQGSRSGSSEQAELLEFQQSQVREFGKHPRELDYTWDELSRMDYSRLIGESFDLIPGVGAGPPKIGSSAELANSLTQILSHQRHGQEGTDGRAFFASLSIDQYEECGDLIIEGFKGILGKFKDARQQKRLLAQKFEEKVQQRQYIIEAKKSSIDKDLKTMRQNGSGLIPRGHSQKLDQG